MMIINLPNPNDAELTDDQWFDGCRLHRDRLLKESDWTQLPDATCNREAWATYRQTLRDFPASWTAGPEADFPDTP